ncbi:MAG: hypothetical protein U0324_41165 [Polyangiales bacterium]
MADVINMMDMPVVVAPSATKVQPLEQAIDVSGYDHLDLAIDVPGIAPTGLRILTSMTLQPDDAQWVEAANFAGSWFNNSANAYLSVPGSGKPLFRYIRWEVTAGANAAAVRITGMARRG